jgi:hypothetical protein
MWQYGAGWIQLFIDAALVQMHFNSCEGDLIGRPY